MTNPSVMLLARARSCSPWFRTLALRARDRNSPIEAEYVRSREPPLRLRRPGDLGGPPGPPARGAICLVRWRQSLN